MPGRWRSRSSALNDRSESALIYADASALVKLAVDDAESSVLRRALRPHRPIFTSELALVEVARAARRVRGAAGAERARRLFPDLATVEWSEAIREAAMAVDPLELRTADAIHLASALTLGSPAFYCYDDRLCRAAEGAGLTVERPA